GPRSLGVSGTRGPDRGERRRVEGVRARGHARPRRQRHHHLLHRELRRDGGKAVIRRVGVDTGGSNIQFAVEPESGRRVVIEMNPRVSRSSALASKATGFPIAYVATKLALGKNLSQIDNQITKITKACFEP